MVREMLVSAVARHAGVTDKRLWRIFRHNISMAMAAIDLSGIEAIGLDETLSKKRHKYIMVFVNLDREDNPVVFATSGKGRECLKTFCEFIEEHGGHSDNICEVVCDISPALFSAVEMSFVLADVTVVRFQMAHLSPKP